MTHVRTLRSLSDLPRVPWPGNGKPAVEWLRASDHFGAHARLGNPAELRTAHLVAALWPDELPRILERNVTYRGARSDFFVRVRDFLPDYPEQRLDFGSVAGKRFRLVAPGRPALGASLSGRSVAGWRTEKGTYSVFGLRVDKEDRPRMEEGVAYELQAEDNQGAYTWAWESPLQLKGRALGQPGRAPRPASRP
jgi:hypothetical protein